MANEINIQAILTVSKFAPGVQGSGNLNITQTNNCANVVLRFATAVRASRRQG